MDTLNLTYIEPFIESFYADKSLSSKLKQIITESVNTKFTHLLIFGDNRYITSGCPYPQGKLINTSDLTYSIKDDSINIKSNSGSVILRKDDIHKYVIVLKTGFFDPSIKELYRELYNRGFLLLNNADEVTVSADKFLSAERLKSHDIPQPLYTIIEPSDIRKGDDSKLEEKLKTLYKEVNDTTKFVCKIPNGHGGKGVFICTKANIMSVLQCFFAIDDTLNIVVQEYIPNNDYDIRAYVLSYNKKQEVLFSYKRNKDNKYDFRTNISLGNTLSETELSNEVKDLALKTAEASGLIWCGVDIMFKNGKPVVIEYNGAPGTPGISIDKDNPNKVKGEFYAKIIDTINRFA